MRKRAIESAAFALSRGPLTTMSASFAAAFSLDLSGTRVALDCASGTYRAAPAIFSALGAELELIAVEPDGRNINEHGSTTPMA